jgi:hypothetical protein
MFLILLLFFNFCHKNLHIFALPSSAVLKPAQAGLVIVTVIRVVLFVITVFIVAFKITILPLFNYYWLYSNER